MKLLFLLGNLSGVGGTERVTCDLASALAERGEEVTILSVFGAAEPFFELSGKVSMRGLGLAEAAGSPLRFFESTFRLIGAIKEQAPEVVIAVDSVLFAFLLPLTLRRGPRILCWEHFHLNTSHGSSLRRLGRYLAARRADKIVVLTQRDADLWKNRFGSNTPVLAIPNAVPPLCKVSPLAEKSGKVLLAVGRMTRQKGFDLLLDAWSKVAPERTNWRLRIVGDGDDRPALEAQAARLGLTKAIEMPGRTSAMAKEYAAADALVMSSRWEGLPMVLLEALQAGLPILSTDCETGPREILGDGAGLLVPSEDVAELAQGLARLTADAPLREGLSLSALRTAEGYRIDAISSLWLEEIRGSK